MSTEKKMFPATTFQFSSVHRRVEMAWFTTASWCQEDSMAGEAMEAQVDKKHWIIKLSPKRHCHLTMLFWTNKMIVAVFLWDKEKQLGFVYIPTYLAWWENVTAVHWYLTQMGPRPPLPWMKKGPKTSCTLETTESVGERQERLNDKSENKE